MGFDRQGDAICTVTTVPVKCTAARVLREMTAQDPKAKSIKYLTILSFFEPHLHKEGNNSY